MGELLPSVEDLRQDNPEQAKGGRESGSWILLLLDPLAAAGELAFGGQEPCSQNGVGRQQGPQEDAYVSQGLLDEREDATEGVEALSGCIHHGRIAARRDESRIA